MTDDTMYTGNPCDGCGKHHASSASHYIPQGFDSFTGSLVFVWILIVPNDSGFALVLAQKRNVSSVGIDGFNGGKVIAPQSEA